MSRSPRNPGPSWGYSFISRADRLLPECIFRVGLRIGSLVATCAMGEQRRASRRYLAQVFGRAATFGESWNHFDAFAQFLVDRFRAADGRVPQFEASDQREDRMESLARNGEQALFGTFHFGQSDMMGFWLSRFELSVRMVRLQVGNSNDIAWLDRRFGDKIGFLWVNDPANLLFSLKQSVDEGHCIAMKCDRAAHSSKLEAFPFLGRKRMFPFTIYHLALMFRLPVVFAFGVKEAGVIKVYSSSVFRPNKATKRENLAAARSHFEEALALLESLVRKNPYQWFNFEDFVDAAPEESAAVASVER